METESDSKQKLVCKSHPEPGSVDSYSQGTCLQNGDHYRQTLRNAQMAVYNAAQSIYLEIIWSKSLSFQNFNYILKKNKKKQQTSLKCVSVFL